MLEIVLFSSICGVFGSALLVMPNGFTKMKESVSLRCGNDQAWGPFTVYDKSADIFKVYHETEGCDENLILGEQPVGSGPGSWSCFNIYCYYQCKPVDDLCKLFDPSTSPNELSLQISHKPGSSRRYDFSCENYINHLNTRSIHSKVGNSHINIPLFGGEGLCRWFDTRDASNPALIKFKSLTQGEVSTFEQGSLGSISVLLPRNSIRVKTGDKYEFKVVMNTTHSLPTMVAMCFKSKPLESCDRYGSKMIAKDAINGISLFLEEDFFSSDVYLEIANWRTDLISSKLNLDSEIIYTHRLNRRILEEAQDQVFSKGDDFGNLYFHFSKCDASSLSCNQEEDGKVRVSLIIYGVAETEQTVYLYVQADRGKRTTTCNMVGSYCQVKFTTTKYKDMILHYEYLEKVCKWKHVFVTEHRTKVCKDISMSVTVVDY